MFVRDEATKELYMLFFLHSGLEMEAKMLYVPPDFKNGLPIDALVDSRAYVSVITWNDPEGINQHARRKISKSMILLTFKFK